MVLARLVRVVIVINFSILTHILETFNIYSLIPLVSVNLHKSGNPYIPTNWYLINKPYKLTSVWQKRLKNLLSEFCKHVLNKHLWNGTS